MAVYDGFGRSLGVIGADIKLSIVKCKQTGL